MSSGKEKASDEVASASASASANVNVNVNANGHDPNACDDHYVYPLMKSDALNDE